MFGYVLLFSNALQKLSENSPKAGSPKGLQKIYESSQKLSESSSKDLQKQALRKALWKLSESSPKAGWLLLKTLQKQADFCWKPSQSRKTFVESSMKAFQKARKN